jgi:hypothetical protein
MFFAVAAKFCVKLSIVKFQKQEFLFVVTVQMFYNKTIATIGRNGKFARAERHRVVLW